MFLSFLKFVLTLFACTLFSLHKKKVLIQNLFCKVMTKENNRFMLIFQILVLNLNQKKKTYDSVQNSTNFQNSMSTSVDKQIDDEIFMEDEVLNT